MFFLFLLALVAVGEVDAAGQKEISTPYLPVGVDCGTTIHPDRLTELAQFFIERNARNELHAPFLRSTEKVCTDLCVHSFVEFNVDKEDILNNVGRDRLIPILKQNFCIDFKHFSAHGRLMIDIDEDMKRTSTQCHALREIENYCKTRECDDFHRQCDMVVRREWCRLQNQNAFDHRAGALDCFVYDNQHKVPPNNKMLNHDFFDMRIKHAVSSVHKQHAAALTKECKATHLSSDCTFDEIYEQKAQQHLRLQATIHDEAQCARVNHESPRWMDKLDCTCTRDKPCTKRVLAREGRIEYHRTRFIDLVMLLQNSVEETDSDHAPKFTCNNGGMMWLSARLNIVAQHQCFPQIFDFSGQVCFFDQAHARQLHCWAGLAAEMIRLLDVESGAFFRKQVEMFFRTFFGSGAVNGLPPLERSLDISDYSLYANVRNEYFRAYQSCEVDAEACGKYLLLGYETWRLQDLMYFVNKLLQLHSNAMPLIIHDDVAQNTLWVMHTLLRRIDALGAPPIPDQADVPHEHAAQFDFDGNPMDDSSPDALQGASVLQTRQTNEGGGEEEEEEEEEEGEEGKEEEDENEREKVEKREEETNGAEENEEKHQGNKREGESVKADVRKKEEHTTEENVGTDDRFEKNHMPPLLSRQALAKDYINALIQLRLSRIIRFIIDGLIERQQLSKKSVGSALPQEGKAYDRRRLGIRLQYYAFLSSPTEWDEYVLEEASDAGVEFRKREKKFIVQACREFRIDAVTSYIPTGHHEKLKSMKHSDFLNGGLLSECSLQHVLVRQNALKHIDDYRQNHRFSGGDDIMAQMELDRFEEDFFGEDEKKTALHESLSVRATLSTALAVVVMSVCCI